MGTIDLERIIKSSTKVKVFNYPVGIDIYFQNPFRICNISPNGDWKDSGAKLRTGFNRFLAFSKINKIEKPPIGDDANFLLSSAVKDGYNKIKANIEKANAKLIWKIFWFNRIGEDYDKMPRDISLIETAKLTDHSKAILFHYQAINETLPILENPKHEIYLTKWEKTLDYWDKTFNNMVFWQEIDEIIESEKTNGNFEFRNFHRELLQKELPESIYNTLIYIPIKYIEQNRANDSESKKYKNALVSSFLKLILKSRLGNEILRDEYAKQLMEVHISKEVSYLLKKDSLNTLADNGNYSKLYDTGMRFINSINEETEAIKHSITNHILTDKNFDYDINRIPEIHERPIEPLLEGIEAFAIMHKEDVDKEIIDKTFFTQLILSLRILCELNISISSQTKLIKAVQDLNSRFSYKKIPSNKLLELNLEKKAFEEIINNGFFSKFYLLQYCYFISGEFAHPDASFYKSYQTTKGIVATTRYTFIPRSKLAANYHQSNIDLDIVKKKMIRKSEKYEIRKKLNKLKKQTKELKNKLEQLNKSLQIFASEEKNLNAGYQEKIDTIEEQIHTETQVLKTTPRFLAQVEPIKNTLKLLDDKKRNVVEKYAIKKKKSKALKEIIFGVFLLITALAYFTGSLFYFHFYEFIGLSLFGVAGLFFIGDADRTKSKLEVIQKAATKEIKEIDVEIEIENSKMDNLTKNLYHVARKKFQKQIDEFDKKHNVEMMALNEKHNAEKKKKNAVFIASDLEIIKNKIEGITTTLKNYIVVKKSDEANSHPIVVIMKGQ